MALSFRFPYGLCLQEDTKGFSRIVQGDSSGTRRLTRESEGTELVDVIAWDLHELYLRILGYFKVLRDTFMICKGLLEEIVSALKTIRNDITFKSV